MNTQEKNVKCDSYTVVALDMNKPRWVLVTEQPLPRQEAALVVAGQWQQGRRARLVPVIR